MRKMKYIGEFDEQYLDKSRILQLINAHRSTEGVRIHRSLGYYEGHHEILRRKKKNEAASNNRLVCNHAKDIADTATSYFLSAPITYSTSDKAMDIDRLTDYFDMADVDETDHDNALDMSRAGIAYEYIYAAQDEARPLIKNLEPQHTFLVYDDTIEENVLFGVYYYWIVDASTKQEIYKAVVATRHYVHTIDIINDSMTVQSSADDPVPHLFDGVPIVEYRNNKDGIGDYEQQISLIDAYNTLMSDRVNDKEQFLEAILVLIGALLGDDEKETGEAAKQIKDLGILELPPGASAEYITRTFDESSVEVLKKAIKDDIYTFSHVPCLTDENFVGNSSGVAMEYKLLGLEMITKTKERYYTKGLKQRMRLICNYLGLKNIALNPAAIIPEFKRGLPKNMLELSQMIANLSGAVSQKTLISQLDFVEDPDAEVEAVRQESQEKVKQQQQAFGNYADGDPGDQAEPQKDEKELNE